MCISLFAKITTTVILSVAEKSDTYIVAHLRFHGCARNDEKLEIGGLLPSNISTIHQHGNGMLNATFRNHIAHRILAAPNEKSIIVA